MIADPTAIAEALVDLFVRGEIDQEELERAIAKAIASATGPKRVRNREREANQWAAIKADPKRLAAHHARKQAAERARRAAEPEKYRERDRIKRQRRLSEDRDKVNAKAREQAKRRRIKHPAAVAVSDRRKGMKRVHPEHREAMIAKVREAARKALNGGIPAHIHDDVLSAVALAYVEGRITVAQAGAEAKAALKAHNRMFDTFKTKSLDAPMGGTDLRLIDILEARP